VSVEVGIGGEREGERERERGREIASETKILMKV